MKQIRLISTKDLDRYVERYPDVLCIDVRSETAYRRAHIAHAINIPYRENQTWKLSHQKRYVLYCDRGAASMAAARELEAQGYLVMSVAGGIQGYRGVYLVS